MIRLLRDMPEGVLGFEAVDDVTKSDYADVVVPAVERAIADRGSVRLVYVLGHDFDDYEGDAVWEDLKLGVRHPTSFERVAVVTDARGAGPAIRVFSVLWPGQARAFALADLESAKQWAADGLD
ncbi:MAG TPA: STAS/SEC14 domain-containing protein [Actinotalea sp.]|nr:STAS/SEC14 domain-containing protein [Actinotalea sp.]